MLTPDAPGPSAIQAAVARIGDRWRLLIVDALLAGPRRFGDLLDQLEGLAPNILSRRLKDLEGDGLVVARPYSRRPPRFSYQLTAAGTELAGALRLLAQWGARHGGAAEPTSHQACGTPVEVRWYCPTCSRLLEDDEAYEAEELGFA
ncbi:MAG: winged helix-turn-helix transcriptional regulator [Acidimicrobiales bacterium]